MKEGKLRKACGEEGFVLRAIAVACAGQDPSDGLLPCVLAPHRPAVPLTAGALGQGAPLQAWPGADSV